MISLADAVIIFPMCQLARSMSEIVIKGMTIGKKSPKRMLMGSIDPNREKALIEVVIMLRGNATMMPRNDLGRK